MLEGNQEPCSRLPPITVSGMVTHNTIERAYSPPNAGPESPSGKGVSGCLMMISHRDCGAPQGSFKVASDQGSDFRFIQSNTIVTL
jgi:hypothetical protein